MKPVANWNKVIQVPLYFYHEKKIISQGHCTFCWKLFRASFGVPQNWKVGFPRPHALEQPPVLLTPVTRMVLFSPTMNLHPHVITTEVSEPRIHSGSVHSVGVDKCIQKPPYPWVMGSDTPNGLLKSQIVPNLYVLGLFLYIHTYDKV